MIYLVIISILLAATAVLLAVKADRLSRQIFNLREELRLTDQICDEQQEIIDDYRSVTEKLCEYLNISIKPNDN